MPKNRRVRIGLSHEDEIIADFRFDERHRLVGFSVTYVARFGESAVEVGRYDNAHGRPHVHRFGRIPRTRFLRTNLPLKELANRAIADFRRNWKKYRARLRRGES